MRKIDYDDNDIWLLFFSALFEWGNNLIKIELTVKMMIIAITIKRIKNPPTERPIISPSLLLLLFTTFEELLLLLLFEHSLWIIRLL